MGQPINPFPDPIKRGRTGALINRSAKHEYRQETGGIQMTRPAIIQDTHIPYHMGLVKEDSSGTNFSVSFPITLTYTIGVASTQNLFLHFDTGVLRSGTSNGKSLILMQLSAISFSFVGATSDSQLGMDLYWVKTDFDPTTITWASRPGTPFTGASYDNILNVANNGDRVQLINTLGLSAGDVAAAVLPAPSDKGGALIYGNPATAKSIPSAYGIAITLQNDTTATLFGVPDAGAVASITIESLDFDLEYVE